MSQEELARFTAPIRWHCDRIGVVVQAGDGRVLGVAISDTERV
jgi:hypothetical protein